MTRMREIRLAGDRAERGEFRRGEAGDVVRVRMRIGHAVEHAPRRARRGMRASAGRAGGEGHCVIGESCARRDSAAALSRVSRTIGGSSRGRRCPANGPAWPKQPPRQPRRQPSDPEPMTAIVDIIAREILDSRGNPTVEVDVVLEDGSHGPRRRAVGRLDRRARGGRAARRRQGPLSAARAC